MFTPRQWYFLLHLGLGVALVHAYAGGLATLLRPSPGRLQSGVRTASTVGLALAAWATVAAGT